jgi:hypothetical protein
MHPWDSGLRPYSGLCCGLTSTHLSAGGSGGQPGNGVVRGRAAGSPRGRAGDLWPPHGGRLRRGEQSSPHCGPREDPPASGLQSDQEGYLQVRRDLDTLRPGRIFTGQKGSYSKEGHSCTGQEGYLHTYRSEGGVTT